MVSDKAFKPQHGGENRVLEASMGGAEEARALGQDSFVRPDRDDTFHLTTRPGVEPYTATDPTDVSRPQRPRADFGRTFMERFEAYNSAEMSVDVVHRIVAQVFLATPITLGTLKGMLRGNVPFPFGFVLFRPYMTYRMGSGILAVAGSSTGETLIGHSNFQLADNVIQKMHYGNFTMYQKSIVYRQHQVSIAENIFAMNYVGGNDCHFFSDRAQLTTGELKHSIFACLVPYEGNRTSDASGISVTHEFPNPMSITGRFESKDHADEKEDDAATHYPSADFYRRYWGWAAAGDPNGTDRAFDSYSRWNTVCYQGHQQNFNPASGQFDLVTTNTGHWGDRVYPGCGRVRKGMQKLLEPVNYLHGQPMHAPTSLGY
jgi:hypothetical protein